MGIVWRRLSNWAKHRRSTLRLADLLGRGRGRWRMLDRLDPPARAPVAPNLAGWENHELAACWIGHATVLLRVAGMNVITDPVLSNRVGVGLGVVTGGPRRLVAPALQVRDLPKLDLILLSHAHFDHLDRPTLSKLNKNVPVITADRTQDLVRDLGFRKVKELRWGEAARVGGLLVSACPVRHWGARTFYDDHRGYNAYLLDAGQRRVLYGGDTAFHEGFAEAVAGSTRIGRGPGVDLAILGIGAYDPYVQAHATPEQALAMADHARADRVLAMHHSTFRLSHEPVEEPLERLLAACRGETDRVVARRIGDVWTHPN